ncbi:MAG: hypothetical protein ACKV2V_29835 [Blastocatellia bacterium]
MEAVIEEVAIEKFRALSPENQQQVLAFIEELERQFGNQRRTIWDKVRNRIEAVPAEAWDELPMDGAAKTDHYLYGAPKNLSAASSQDTRTSV